MTDQMSGTEYSNKKGDSSLRESALADINHRRNDITLERADSTVSGFENNLEGTLISRQWYYVMPGAILLYIIIQIIMIKTQVARCHIDEPFAEWTQKISIAVLSCFTLSLAYHITNGISVECWAQKELSHLRGVYASAATMSFIGGTATALSNSFLGESKSRALSSLPLSFFVCLTRTRYLTLFLCQDPTLYLKFSYEHMRHMHRRKTHQII